MSITFSCPKCQCKMTVPDALSGKRGKCSKCKEALTVPVPVNGTPTPAAPSAAGVPTTTPPATRGDSTPPPANKGATARKASAPPPNSPVPGPPAKTDAAPEDLEAAALAALSDEPAAVQEAKDRSVIEFECPMCFEPLKVPSDLGGKKHPCEHCRRIIQVPMPKVEDRTSWRDTGPNLPSAAKRDEGPALEGAWGSKQVTTASREGLLETGVIEAKRKPLTTLQKLRPYLLLGSPVLILLVGGIVLYSWLARNKEKHAFDYAMAFAASEKSRATVGDEGLAELHGQAARYYLRGDRPGDAALARDQLLKAANLAGASRNTVERDALLIDLVDVALDLSGSPEEIAAATRLKWDDTQKTLRTLLFTITAPAARMIALRRVSAVLTERGQSPRVLALVAQLYTGADRSEALGVAGMELLHQGKKDEALKAAEMAEAPFAAKKGRPPLRSAVVALSLALERKPPKFEGTEEEENTNIGEAIEWANRKQMEKAREAAGKVKSKAPRFRALVALAETKNAEETDLTAALTALDAQPWELLRLLNAAIRHGIPAERLEPVAAAIPRQLAGWGQLLLLRSRLAASRSIEPADVLEQFPAKSLAGEVARLELSRHNTQQDSSWANTVKSWQEGPRAFGSLGVALGMQKGK